MTHDDVLFGYRLRLFTLAEELGNVTAACRQMEDCCGRALLYWMLNKEWRLGRRAGPTNVLQGGSGRQWFGDELC